jgi:RNA polymerase sigma-70 factor, ECF subfamily
MAALEQLIRRHQRVLYTVAIGMLGDATKARETTQMALLRACGQLSSIDAAHGFQRSAHRLLIDECLNVLGRDDSAWLDGPPIASEVSGEASRQASGEVSREVSGEASGEASGSAAAVRVSTAELCDCRVRGALLKLVPELRAPVVLRHFARLSYEEMAAALDLPSERVRSRLHAARQQLGERLLGEHVDAPGGAAALRELGVLLHMLGSVEPPADLVPDVLFLIAMLGSGSVWVNGESEP